MKYAILVIGLLFYMGGFAQVEPFKVKVKDGGRLPEVYALAESQFTFNGISAVDEALIIHGGAQWQIEKFSAGVFKVKCKVYGRSQTVELDSIIKIRLILNNGDTLNMTAPIRVYADVKILPYGINLPDIEPGILPCEEKIGFHATWVYPKYVKRLWRVMGVFDIDLLKGEDRLMGFTGWYDAGDRTKLQSIAHFSPIASLKVKVTSLKTLHRYTQNGVLLTIYLSEDYPSVWRMECD